MNRIKVVLPTTSLILLLLIVFSSPATGQQFFATNTPIPTAMSFATNTPEYTPTDTATVTPPPTATPTPTFTPTPSNTPTPTHTPSDTPTPTPTPIGPFSYPEGVNPLTGQMYPDAEAMARRNLIVKISNYPPLVRPQHGVNKAGVVYEYEAEGGVTRFAAIFRSNSPERVGSIRSARLIDIELVAMYRALLAYSGTSEPIQNMIMSSDWVYQAFSPLKGDGCQDSGFCRYEDAEKALEHTMFLDTRLLYQRATARNINTGYRALGFAFREEPLASDVVANDIFIQWWGQTDARWIYDELANRYVRYTEGVAHYDAAENEQIWTDNLIVIEVPHERRPDLFTPGVNYESLEIQLWDQGFAYVFRDGKFYQGYWRRNSKNPGDALQLILPGAPDPIMLKPGRSWVTVVRGLSNVSISAEKSDMVGTATAIKLYATPNLTPTPVDD